MQESTLHQRLQVSSAQLKHQDCRTLSPIQKMQYGFVILYHPIRRSTSLVPCAWQAIAGLDSNELSAEGYRCMTRLKAEFFLADLKIIQDFQCDLSV